MLSHQHDCSGNSVNEPERQVSGRWSTALGKEERTSGPPVHPTPRGLGAVCPAPSSCSCRGDRCRFIFVTTPCFRKSAALPTQQEAAGILSEKAFPLDPTAGRRRFGWWPPATERVDAAGGEGPRPQVRGRGRSHRHWTWRMGPTSEDNGCLRFWNTC